MGFHVWTILLDLIQREPVYLSAAITAVGIVFAISMKWVIHGEHFGWAHLMIGSDLSLAGILIALLQGIKIDEALRTQPVAAVAQGILPAIAITCLGALCLLVSVNMERLAHLPGAKAGPIRFIEDLAFGGLVAATAVFSHF